MEQGFQSLFCFGALDVACGCGPKNDAQRAVDLKSLLLGDQTSGGIVGQQPLRPYLNSKRESLRLPRIQQTGSEPAHGIFRKPRLQRFNFDPVGLLFAPDRIMNDQLRLDSRRYYDSAGELQDV